MRQPDGRRGHQPVNPIAQPFFCHLPPHPSWSAEQQRPFIWLSVALLKVDVGVAGRAVFSGEMAYGLPIASDAVFDTRLWQPIARCARQQHPSDNVGFLAISGLAAPASKIEIVPEVSVIPC